MTYSPFFQTLHDEQAPVGDIGRGAHYSVLRAVTWHDDWLHPLDTARLLDFAVVWDEDHDTRVIEAVEGLYFDGLLAPVKFIGERKGMLTILVDAEYWGEPFFDSYKSRVSSSVDRNLVGDSWGVDVDRIAGRGCLISGCEAKVTAYITFIQLLWNLGVKDRPPVKQPEFLEARVVEIAPKS